VLLVRPDHLGDLLLTSPAIAHLRAALPGAHLALLVGPWNAEAAAGLPGVDEVLTLPFPFFDRGPKGGPLHPYAVLLREARRLAGLAFDTAVILRHDFWWGAMLAARAGIPRRVGFACGDVTPFLTEALPAPWPEHEAARCLGLAQRFTGSNAAQPPMQFQPSASDHAFAASWLEQQGVASPFVALHPGSGAAVKLWRAGHWAAVVRQLAQHHQTAVVITGSAAEQGLVESVRSESAETPTASLTGATLGQLAAVISRAALAAGPDSGVLHLAEAVGTPTVRLFGPASAQRFGPWGDASRHRVVRAELACVPCGRLDQPAAELPLHPCVRAITVPQVLQAIETLLAPAAVH
jgi:heptosyltransferase-2/heptosyltransferase-3